MFFWASLAFSLVTWVFTTMPSVTGVPQAIWSFGNFFDLHHAHAAVAVHGQVVVIAEARNPHPRLLRRLDDGGARGDFDFLTVDRDLGHVCLPIHSPATTLRPPIMATASAIMVPLIISG